MLRLLKISILSFLWPHGHILQGVDLEGPQGRICSVLGRNGVGKRPR